MDDAIIPRIETHHLERIIAELTEGVIVIRPDGAIIWANPVTLAMHGVPALSELGRTADQYACRFDLRYRNRHPLPKARYPIHRAVAGEGFSDVVVEVAAAGEAPRWVHRIRSLVLENAKQQPDCVVLILNDETERFNAEERFERAFNVNPAPALLCRLGDLRFIKLNRGFEEMTGYARAGIIGRSLYEIDVLEDVGDRQAAIAHLRAGRTIAHTEASLPLPDGRRKSVIVAGQPIEFGGDTCMMFTFVDLDPRREAEEALRRSEERFAKTFRMGPLPMLIASQEESRVLDVNEAFMAVFGYTGEEAVGQRSGAMALWGNAASHARLEQALRKTGSVRNLECRLHGKGGATLDCLVSAETVSIDGQACVLCVLQDITERRRSEDELAAAIGAVLAEPSWFSQNIMERLANLRLPHAFTRDAALDHLSSREREVLGLLCQGQTDAQIADRLALSRNTVRNQVASIYRKIGVNRRSGAIVWARARGFTGDGAPMRPGRAKRPPG